MSNEPVHEVDGVPIGRAAALYGLAPSTLRWWEAQGVLPEPPRVNGRRLYTEPELRRIGLAYLCCVTGAMPLEHTAAVTSGGRAQWQSAVQRHTARIEEMIQQLQSAHHFLLRLLQCPDDDVVRECPDLDEELMNHTPRGRCPTLGLVAAAQSLPLRTAAGRRRDGTGVTRDEKSAAADRCTVCAEPLVRQARGRRREYCSRACQQRQYRQKIDRHSVAERGR